MCFPLDPQQRKRIARRQQTRDYRLGMRLSTLLWRDDGKTESEIAQLLGVCERTVRKPPNDTSPPAWHRPCPESRSPGCAP